MMTWFVDSLGKDARKRIAFVPFILKRFVFFLPKFKICFFKKAN